ncbi:MULTISPECIES: hypothetical protein [Natrinema]|uniref:Uncharacterized protein n=1 Tax=Natrinema gari JCM 14663 TaxID=1230459 RepID=L9YSH7_9EURY|nr:MULTISPECIES: hypothetical protein [Natrinema]AFO58886.1 hypothetical protein NJ7G_3670 [Natrinema sp. J7-2]ELY77059.1 hypothetical protein C486_16450 [Natrinema gari JCM 14663]
MFGPLYSVLLIAGAYAVYVDATERETDSPIGWAIATLAVGYALGPILLGVFLLLYLVLHAIEARWGRWSRGHAV